MPRQKKVNSSQPKSDEILLSKEEVWNVIEFAQNLYGYNNGMFPGVYNPSLVNASMQNLTMNPQQATSDLISDALAHPKESQQELIGYSEYLELSSMIYKRVLNYFSGLLAFNYTYVCTNAKTEDYKSKKYKDDLKRVEKFFDRFDLKNEFSVVLREIMRQEAYFGIFRTDDPYRNTIQELPTGYSTITGRWSMGMLFDFNMILFYQPGMSLDMFPPIFTKMFKKVFGDTSYPKPYNPALPINKRSSTYVTTSQTSPKDGFWCFKLFPEQATIVPFLAPFMKDVILQDMVRELQKNSYIAEASKLLVGSVKFLDNTKSSVKDALSLSPETLGKFLQLIKSGLPSAIKTVAAPLEGLTGVEFAGSNGMYDSYLKSTSSSSGVNSRLIYSYDRQNVLETRLSMDIDMNILRPILSQFNNFLEYYVNKETKHFKFKFSVEGFNTSLDREMRLQNAMQYADSGIILEQKLASALDMTPFDFRRMLEESQQSGFVDKLTPILKANQMSAKDGEKEKGRPAKKDKDLTEGGSESRESGSNEESE